VDDDATQLLRGRLRRTRSEGTLIDRGAYAERKRKEGRIDFHDTPVEVP